MDKNNIGEILANYNLAVLTQTAKPPNLIPRQISGYKVCEVTMQRPHLQAVTIVYSLSIYTGSQMMHLHACEL